VWLFLDFDGVLRRDSSTPGCFEGCCLDPLCDLLREFPAVRIVVSSAWRVGMGLDEIRDRFPTDVARRIVDATPDLGPLLQGRHQEVLTWLRAHGGADQDWVALDDDPTHFPRACANLVLVDPARGFDREAAEELSRRLTQAGDASARIRTSKEDSCP
jgi:hypothetical protein